jgi:hypothetical protein
MWSFGYTDPVISENGPVDVYWGESDRFACAVSELYDNVEKMASDAEPYEESHYATVLAAIRTIRDDPAYWYDEDQGEDMEFYDESGLVSYYVMDL